MKKHCPQSPNRGAIHSGSATLSQTHFNSTASGSCSGETEAHRRERKISFSGLVHHHCASARQGWVPLVTQAEPNALATLFCYVRNDQDFKVSLRENFVSHGLSVQGTCQPTAQCARPQRGSPAHFGILWRYGVTVQLKSLSVLSGESCPAQILCVPWLRQ